jgi:hypothetical protein
MGGAIIAVLANAGVLKKWHGLCYILFSRGALVTTYLYLIYNFRERPASDSKVSIRGRRGGGGGGGVRGNHGIGSFFLEGIGGQTNIFTHTNTNFPTLIIPSVLLEVHQIVLNDL